MVFEPKNLRQRLLLTFLAVIWSGFSLGGWGLFTLALVRQLGTLGYVETTGVMEKSVAVDRGSSDGETSYGVVVRYHYTVGGGVEGRELTGQRLRFGANAESGPWAENMVARFPEGARVRVFYDARRPTEAVLIQGIEGSDLFMEMFMTPFVLISIGMWVGVWRTFRGPRGLPGLAVVQWGQTTRVRRSRKMAIGAGLVIIGLLSFFLIFPMAFFYGGFHPSIWAAGGAWGVTLAAGAAATVATWHKDASGREDLVLDEGRQMWRVGRVTERHFGDVERVRIEVVEKEGRAGVVDKKREIWLDMRRRDVPGGASVMVNVRPWPDAAEAENFAVWLGLRLGVRVEESEARPGGTGTLRRVGL